MAFHFTLQPFFFAIIYTRDAKIVLDWVHMQLTLILHGPDQ